MKNKFNCVEMQHKGAERISEELAGLNSDEELAYWQKQTQELKKRQKSKAKQSSPPT